MVCPITQGDHNEDRLLEACGLLAAHCACETVTLLYRETAHFISSDSLDVNPVDQHTCDAGMCMKYQSWMWTSCGSGLAENCGEFHNSMVDNEINYWQIL